MIIYPPQLSVGIIHRLNKNLIVNHDSYKNIFVISNWLSLDYDNLYKFIYL